MNIHILLEVTAQGCKQKEREIQENSLQMVNSEPCLWSDTHVGTASVSWSSGSAPGPLHLCRAQLSLLHTKLWSLAQETPQSENLTVNVCGDSHTLFCCGWVVQARCVLPVLAIKRVKSIKYCHNSTASDIFCSHEQKKPLLVCRTVNAQCVRQISVSRYS